MKTGKTSLDRYTRSPALGLILLFLAAVLVFYLVIGENARIAVADNMDLFQAQYQMLKNEGIFFTQGSEAPFLGGISRDVLPSELSLTGLLYILLPSFAAYVALYLLKIVTAVVSFCLLAQELKGRILGPESSAERAAGSPEHATFADGGAGEKRERAFASLSLLCGFAYGILNLFPSFGICFASIPLILWIILRLERASGKKEYLLCLAGCFLYPLVSYFSYFGLFILAYMAAAFLLVSICRKKPDLRLLAAIVCMSAGSILFEYRLFRSMLFSDEITIRSTMVIADLSAGEILSQIRDVFLTGGAMHTQSMHRTIVLPVCVLYFLGANLVRIFRKDLRAVREDVFNLGALTLVFNSVVYGMYYCGPFRRLVEALVPPLEGWQFGRTSFFNPFLWYALFFIVLVRLYGALDAAYEKRSGKDSGAAGMAARLYHLPPYLLVLLSILVILKMPGGYNDLYNTAHAEANRLLRGVEEDSLTYREFYSEDLFDAILEDIGYEGEWSAAYDLYPATLEYNGIRTLDGYLGFYSQEYKDNFRKIIAPALAKQEPSRQYFDAWGARCYLYSGTNVITVEPTRSFHHNEEPLDIDPDAFRALGGRYIFSRIKFNNADALGLVLRGTYEAPGSPYVLYVYDAGE